MLLLTSTTSKLQVVTGAAASIDVHASYVDNNAGAIAPGSTNSPAITTATTTDIVASPGAGVQRNVKGIYIVNTHASNSCQVTLFHTDGTNVKEIMGVLLLAGENLNFTELGEWHHRDQNGGEYTATTKIDAVVRVTADVVNSTVTFADVTGLTYPVKSGKRYVFEAHLIHITAATTTGAQFGVNGPAMTYMRASQIGVVTPSATAAAMASGVATALATNAVAETTGPGTTEAEAILSGYIEPSADGTFAIQCRSEVAASALTVRKGSWLWIREVDN